MSARALPAKAENLFRYLFEQTSLGIAVEDLDGKILLANRALCSMMGYQDDELVGLNCSQFANSEDSQDDWALFQQLRAGAIGHYSIEKRYVKKDGAPLWGRLNVSLLKPGDGESPLVFAFVENITKHKLAEEALHQKEKELTETQHQAGIGSWSWDARSDRMIWSRELFLRTGHNPDSPAPNLKEQAGLFTPESWDRLLRSVRDAMQTGTSYELDLELVRPLSGVRWATTRGEPLRDADGQIIGLRGTVQDITAHKLAEQELGRTNDRFRLAMEASKSAGWEWDPKSGQLSWFGDLQSMFGISSDSFVGRIDDFYRCVHPEDRPMVTKVVADARQNRKQYVADFRVVRRDGMVRWVSARGSFYYEANGDPVRMLGMAADVTERKQMEERLREYEKTVECSTDSITVIDRDYRYLIANRTFLKLRNMTKEQTVGRLVPEVLNKGVFEAVVKDRLDECFAGKIVKYELRYTYPDLGERDLLISYFPIEGNKGIDRVACIAQDITERKRAQDGLRESEQRLRLAVQAGGMYAFDWDVVSDEIVRSKESVDILNWKDPEHDTGRGFHARIHPDDETLYTATEAMLTPENPGYQISFRTVSPSGDITWLEDTGRASFDSHGKMMRVIGMVADITRRKLAEAKLRESEERFRLAAQAGRMYAYEWNAASDLVTRSEAYVDIFGLLEPEEQITRQQLTARVHPDDRARFVSSYDHLTPENPTTQISYRVLRPDGSVIWLEKSGRAFFDAQGKLSRVMGMVADITERTQTEEALRQKEGELTEAQRLAGVGNWQWDAQKDNVIWSKELSRLAGRDPNLPAPSFKEHPDLFTVESWEQMRAAIREALQTGTLYDLEMEMLTLESTTKWVIARGEALRDSGGQIIGLRGTIQDITERRRAEEKLRESEARERARVKELEAILDAVPVPVLIAHDAECRYMTGNRAASEQLREPRGQNLSQSAPPGERPAFRQIENGVEISADLLPMQQAAATGKPIYQRELTLLYEDGTTRDEIANAVPLLDEAGKARGAVGASMDVTQLKRTERALRESEDKLRLLLDSTAEAIYGIDLEHRCTFCNPAGIRTLGYEHVDEVLGKNMHKLIHHTRADGTPFPEEECQIHQVTQTGEGVHAEDEVLWRANGTSFPTEYWSYPQRIGQEVVGAVITFIDITERKLAEAAFANVSRKLIEAQEQERTRIGRELHDDIGQRLALLAVELQRLQKDPLILPRHRNRLDGLQKKASEIAADTQSLSHELHSARLQYLGVTAAMRGFCREFGERQQVKVDFRANDMPAALSTEISLCLFRVLQEALHNSAKHSGGQLFEVRVWGTANEIHLTVRDSGKGFDRETAKTSQGIGLISMEERLKLVNGTLSIDSQPGRGTTIEARVPVISGIESMGIAG